MSGMEHQQNMMTEKQRQIGSWVAGLLALSGLAFFIFASIAIFVIQDGVMDVPDRFLLPGTGVMFITSIIGFLLIRRQSNILGAWLVFIVSVLGFPVLATMVLKEIYIVSISSIIVFAYIFRTYIFQKAREQRQMLILTGAAALIIVGFELWNPVFREESSVNTPAFAAGVMALAVLTFIALVFRRALAGSIRSKIVAGILATGGLSLMVLAYFAVSQFGQFITTLTGRLETTVILLAEDQLVNQAETEAGLANQFFEDIAKQTHELAEYRIALQNQQNTLIQGTYWNAQEKLIPFDDGKYGNPSTDVSSVFVPSTTKLDEAVVKDLNTSVYLDFSVPQLLEENPALLAVYYINEFGVVRYYPNVELASLLPSDFDATKRPYYEITAPLFNPQKVTRWTIPYVDAAGGGLVVTVAEPVYLQGRFSGVVAADVRLSTLTERISSIKVGQTGYALMIDDAGRIISMPAAGYELFGLDPNDFPADEYFKQTLLGTGSVELEAITKRMAAGGRGLNIIPVNEVDTYIAYSRISSNGYSLAIIVPVSEMQTAMEISRNETDLQIRSAIRTAAIILVFLMLGAIIISLGLGQIIAGSVSRLTHTANQILEGDITAQADVTTRDEIGTLAQAFNAMTARLRETLAGLEKTVDERTTELVHANEDNQRRAKQFQSIAQIARTISSTLDLDSLLTQTTNVISREFGFYHVGIFLLDKAREYAVLSASNSEGGQVMLERGHKLKVGEMGLVGFVSSTGRPRVASDTGADAVFFNNPDLPETRSEIALPLRAGEDIVGVLDVQSTEPNAFSREDINILSTLADQVSIAIQNARQNEETHRALAESETLSRQFVQSGWSQSNKKNLLGVRHTGVKTTLLYADKNAKEQDEKLKRMSQIMPQRGGAVLALPIKLRGEVIGSVDVQSPENHQWDQDEIDIVTAIIERAAIAMENSRLLEDAQRRVSRELAIGEMSASIGASTDTEAILRATVSEIAQKIGGARVVFELGMQDEDKKRSKSK
jgi:GAF domain-containing protein/HAMP domain-containing protein